MLEPTSTPPDLSELAERLQQTLGTAYRVEHELPGGGMSRVFVAQEVELGRRIVVKVLPPDLAAGLSVERFRREIQLAARLQHPHIVALLSAGARDGLLFYTMPFIEGESLRARIVKQHELPVRDAVRILRDVADALAYAHKSGVVHRDIKPDNVLLSGQHALVTDFGVSKAVSISTGANDLTSIGVALGTPAYMSPEQATADGTIDHRADIYSLGVLAYELLTGRHPFTASSPQQMLSAHIAQDPEPLSKHRSAVPPALEEIVLRCLEKKPADRWQSADELLAQLEGAATPSTGTQPLRRLTGSRGSRRWWFAAGAALSAIAIVGLALKARSPLTYETLATTQITNTAGVELHPAISPDGRFVAYAAGTVGRLRIFVRQVSGGRAVNLTETLAGDHRVPQWTADGNAITFASDDGMYVVPQLGGTPKRLWSTNRPSAPGYGSAASLSPDGKTLAYMSNGRVFVRPVDGGDSVVVGEAKDPSHPVWSRDGSKVAYIADNPDFLYATLSLGNVAPSAIWIGFPDGRPPVRVTNETDMNTSPAWTPEGNLLFVSNGAGGRDIYEQRLTSAGNSRGAPLRVTTGLNVHSITLSADGTRLAYSTFNRRTNVWTVPLGAAASAARPVMNENQLVEGAAASHDGEWLVYDSNRGGRQQLYKIPVGGGEPEQLTRDSTDHFAARWMRDDKQLVYHAWNHGTRDLFIINADGSGQRQLTNLPGHEYYPDISPDGTRLVFRHVSLRSAPGIAMMELEPSGSWSAPRTIRENMEIPRLSPDGSYIAATGPPGILVSRADGTAQQIFAAPPGWRAAYPVWSRDGGTIYFSAAKGGEIRIFSIRRDGTGMREVLQFPDPNRRQRRIEFDVSGSRLFVTLAEDESDVYVLELRRR